MKIVVPDDFPPVYQGHPQVERLRQFGEVVVYSTKAASTAELYRRLAGVPVIINVRSYTVFDRALFQACPDLRMISILGTGTDNVDLAAANEFGVVVTNTPGASTGSVAELTMALMLATARHIALADRKVREGEWYHTHGFELRDKTLGLVGLGAIGQEVARLGAAFGMKVIAWSMTKDPERAARLGIELVELDALLRQADVVSLHLRASPQTAGIIGERELSLMKSSAVLINTARGVLVDETALAQAVGCGRIAGAGIDVFCREPLDADSSLRESENLVLSPHVGWVTHEASERLTIMPVDNIAAYLTGKPQFVVKPEALAHPKQK
jgi:D-3-phosphoglycerate dehydrogenase / 2-oxoglutarate reductase